METTQLYLLIGAVVFIALFFFVVLPKLKLSLKSGVVFRALIFFSMMVYLGYDFYQKEKYGYIIVLVAGSIGFVVLLLAKKKD